MTLRIASMMSLLGFAAFACTYQPPTIDPNLKCGDGIEDPEEECDDGNRDDEDGCDSNCTVTACGNGIPTHGEECDDGNSIDEDSCTAACRHAVCGDGFVQASELCDDGDSVDGNGCESNCIPSGCGNGIIAGEEVCDDSNTNNGDSCNPSCTLTNTTSVFIGTPMVVGHADGAAEVAQLSDRPLMAIFGSTMYFTGANTVRMVDIPTGTVKTIAGQGNMAGWVDSLEGFVARFGDIDGLATDGKTLWVAERDYHVLRAIELTSGKYAVTTVAGAYADPNAVVDSKDGIGVDARFNELRGLVYFNSMLYMLDSGAGIVQQFEPVSREVKTIAGTSGQLQVADGIGPEARFLDPRLITSDGTGLFYITDADGRTIRRFNSFTKEVVTIAGAASMCGYLDATGANVRLNRPRGITTDGKNVYFTEPAGQTIRQLVLDTGQVTTLSGLPAACASDCTCPWNTVGGYAEGAGKSALWNTPWDIAYDPMSKWLYVSDSDNFVIRRIK